jgi:hypothetical protein
MEFNYDHYHILCPKDYIQAIAEIFLLDIYRISELIEKNDYVLDLGAGVGDFSVVASRKVGKMGKIIAVEPDIERYRLLKLNLEYNRCQNVIPLNIGVGQGPGEKELVFWNRTIRCRVDTLENILSQLNINHRINCIKMDIEGFEREIVTKSIKTIKDSRVISIECHGTKEKMDEALLEYGFHFKSITMVYIYKQLIKNLFLHPINFYRVFINIINEKPHIVKTAFTGFDVTKGRHDLVVGSYTKNR